MNTTEEMTSSSTYRLLSGAESPEDLLRQLKDLKNSVIGNTWRKVEVAEDEQLLSFLLGLLDSGHPIPGDDGKVDMELVGETAVIVGALANVGTLTLRPLLTSQAPHHLLNLITSIAQPTPSSSSVDRLLPSLLRALRNMLVSTADVVWGHMWGVGAEQKVVGTGLVGGPPSANGRKGKGVLGKTGWKVEAGRALSLVFEPKHLDTLLSMLQTQTDPQTLLPLYQLFARLVALPSHRQALLHSQPFQKDLIPGPSSSTSNRRQAAIPFVIHHLLSTIITNDGGATQSVLGGRKQNPKLIEAALELVAALIKGQSSLASAVRAWSSSDSYAAGSSHGSLVFGESTVAEGEYSSFERQEFLSYIMGMVVQGHTSVRIAAASCLTSILKADKGSRTSDKIRTTVLSFQLLEEVVKLLQTEGLEERVKLCFILAALVSDDATLQKSAADKGCPAQLVSILVSVDREEERGEVGIDVASRAREATLLALASLAMQYDPTRSFISDTDPSVLPIILRSLSHPSYGVRAAGCQLARALSRAIALLRTTLTDSGIGEEVIRLLKREVEARDKEIGSGGAEGLERTATEGLDDIHTMESLGELELVGDRGWTVEVAATATICNLIADFSPLKMTLLRDGGLEMLCDLTKSPYEAVALNALWAIKNLTFHAGEGMKGQVIALFGWERLRLLLSPYTEMSLRTQAFEITQNLLADSTPSELSRTVDHLGEKDLLDLIISAFSPHESAGREGGNERDGVNMKIPPYLSTLVDGGQALYVLSNLALGNERLRGAIVARVEILEILSESLNSPSDPLRIPALFTLRHLLESNAKTHRPRQGVLDIFQPYQLKPRLRALAEGSGSLDVCEAAVGLLEVVERSRT